MDIKTLSERDICTKFINPAIEKSGWDLRKQVREEVSFTDGRIIVQGKIHTRGKQKRADYILYHKPNVPIAIIEVILQEAWSKLYDYEIPFDIYFGFGCEYLRKILCDVKFETEMNGKPIFGLFDFDEAYNHWNSLKTEGDLLEDDPFKGLCKKVG